MIAIWINNSSAFLSVRDIVDNEEITFYFILKSVVKVVWAKKFRIKLQVTKT